jgi:hypothetical protein
MGYQVDEETWVEGDECMSTYHIRVILPAVGGTTTTEVLPDPYPNLEDALRDAKNGSLRIQHTEWVVRDQENIVAVFWNGGRVK